MGRRVLAFAALVLALTPGALAQSADRAPESPAPSFAGASDLVLTGVIDGPLVGGLPKAIEVYIVNDVADLSAYGLGSANNGGGSDGEEFTFPAVAAAAGTFLYVATEIPGFTAWFGFAPDYTAGAANINGDDAIELFRNGSVVDTFGDINQSGTGQPWEYLDGWAYRESGTGPDGASFVLANWTFSGPNALDGETSNATAETPFPTASYAPGVGCPSDLLLTDFDTTDGDEFFELTYFGVLPVALTDCVALTYDVYTGYAALAFDLDDVTLTPSETYRIGNAGVAGVDQTAPVGFLPEPWGFGLVRGDLVAGDVAYNLGDDILTALIYLAEDAVYLFHHEDPVLEELYCALYAGRISPQSPEVCPAARVAARRDGRSGSAEAFLAEARALQASLGGAAADEAASASSLPSAHALHAAYPNPVRGVATVGYDLPEAAAVRLTVYDALGREVAVLVDAEREAGRHAVSLDAASLPSGTYLVRLVAGPFAATRRVTVAR